MKHYGDITKIHGYSVEPVDIITGGSPCQDLSVAGKRAGLDGERSGLFMDQVRIVKEMRENDVRTFGRTGQFVRPRYMVWENVPGAFSSNGGKDFQAVLTEIVRIVKKEAPNVPMPPDGKWQKCGLLSGVGDSGCPFSVAWKLHDAQYWGVAQRRKRIALLCDFNGLSAGDILFDPQYRRKAEGCESVEAVTDFGVCAGSEVLSERESLSGNLEPSGEARQGTAGTTADCAGKTVFGIDQQGGKGTCGYGINVCPTIAGDSHGTPHAISFQERAGCAEECTDSAICLQGNGIDRADTAGCNGRGWRRGGAYTLNTIDRPAVYDEDPLRVRGGGQGPSNSEQQERNAGVQQRSDSVLRHVQPCGDRTGGGILDDRDGGGRTDQALKSCPPDSLSDNQQMQEASAIRKKCPRPCEAERAETKSPASLAGGAESYAVDVRNGAIDENTNATLQQSASHNVNSNNTVLTSQ